MKVVARINHIKWLLEVSREELEELDSRVDIEVSAEYDILKAAKTLESLRSLSRLKVDHVKIQIDHLQQLYTEICNDHEQVMLLDTIANLSKDRE